MRHLFVMSAGLLFAGAAAGQGPDRPFMPMHAGAETRPDGWDSDSAPRPPAVWRGHGGDRWPAHYRACRQQYPSYDRRTDTYRRGNRRVRCAL